MGVYKPLSWWKRTRARNQCAHSGPFIDNNDAILSPNPTPINTGQAINGKCAIPIFGDTGSH